MSEQKVVKGILLEDGTVALYDFEAVANVPKVIKEIPVAKVGQYLVVEEVDSDGKITKVKAVNGSSSATESLDVINLYVCSDGEYTAGGSPTIAEPDKETFYLVPQDNEGFQYASWVYENDSWEFVDTLTITLDDDKVDETGSSMNITGAQVGQMVVVKAVDENGKPTEWEAVDTPKIPDNYLKYQIVDEVPTEQEEGVLYIVQTT